LDERNERLEELLATRMVLCCRHSAFRPTHGSLETVAALTRDPVRGCPRWVNAEDLAWVGRMLDSYSNLYIDMLPASPNSAGSSRRP